MNNKYTVLAVPAVFLSAAGIGYVSPAAAAKAPKTQQRPNIIYILADDLGYECLGIYGSTYKTPNLDALAAKGMLYRNCHAMPLSSPTRVQTMTGKYNYKNYTKFGYMDPKERTFGNLAKEAGYATAMVGKWQLEGDLTFPAMWGFDEYCLFDFILSKEDGERYADPAIICNGKRLEHNINLYGPDIFEDYVEDFITRSAKGKNKPFFLYYPMVLVHKPFSPTPDSPSWREQEKRKTSNASNFPDMVQYMDKMVGRLVAKLKTEGVYDNTLIIFTADNGTQKDLRTPMKDGTSIKGGKSTTRDAGTHVPLIITWPARIEKGKVMEQLVDMTDFLPTFSDLMKVNIPADWDYDGISILPQLLGQNSAIQRKWTLCHYDVHWEGYPSDNASRHVRTVRYKLYLRGGFYDLKNDIFEKTPINPVTLTGEAREAYMMLNGVLESLPPWSNEYGVSKSSIMKLPKNKKRAVEQKNEE